MNGTTFKNPSKETNNLHTNLLKYWVYWPWAAICIALCLTITTIWLRYQTPVYRIHSALLIKEQSGETSRNTGVLAGIEEMGIVSMTNSFDNEIEILKSQTIVHKVVTDLCLYIDHREKRTWGYDVPIYGNEPVKVYMSPEEADKLESEITVEMHSTSKGNLIVEVKYTYQGRIKKITETFDTLPAALPTEAGILTFTPQNPAEIKSIPKLIATISSPDICTIRYTDNLSVKPTSKTTTIAQTSVLNTVPQRGIDFIYRLVDIYNREANDEKNEVAQKTAEFIEERIAIIDRELGSTEESLANFKQRSRLTDLESDAQMALQETSRYGQQLTENATQRNLIQDLKSYIDNPANRGEVIPANTGISDPNLAHVINQYNTMIGERKRLLRTSSETNPAVVQLNSGIDAMHNTVQTTVSSVLRGLEMAEKNLMREARKHEGRIADAPAQEKAYRNIARQQEIKASLYTMLLQKREENAITLASTASNGRIIEAPVADKAPVSPQKKVFYLAALMLGVVIPAGIIYLKEFLSFRIERREDVEKITSIPVIAELPKADIGKSVRGSIVVHENRNHVMEEAFRHLRTNLLFMLPPGGKVMMVTSSQPSEGKSFVAGNLAVSLAYLGKKVILIGMDLRKAGMDKVFGLKKHALGITNYLAYPDTNNLNELIIPSDISPNLDLLPRGSVPPNPTELVARTSLENAIEELKERYDLIVLDTAPIPMVTDTTLISRVADICLYVCRADYTQKAALEYIHTLEAKEDFCKMAIALNGIDLSKRKHRVMYKYGYGQKYGYGE